MRDLFTLQLTKNTEACNIEWRGEADLLLFTADPADMLQARRKARMFDEETFSITFLHSIRSPEEVGEHWFFESGDQIQDFIRGEKS